MFSSVFESVWTYTTKTLYNVCMKYSITSKLLPTLYNAKHICDFISASPVGCICSTVLVLSHYPTTTFSLLWRYLFIFLLFCAIKSQEKNFALTVTSTTSQSFPQTVLQQGFEGKTFSTGRNEFRNLKLTDNAFDALGLPAELRGGFVELLVSQSMCMNRSTVCAFASVTSVAKSRGSKQSLSVTSSVYFARWWTSIWIQNRDFPSLSSVWSVTTFMQVHAHIRFRHHF